MGKEAVDRDSFDEAIQWFETAIAARPKLVVSHVCLGLALDMTGRDEEALESFENAACLDPEDPVPLYNVARVLVKLERYADAFEVLSQLVATYPDIAADLASDEAFAAVRHDSRFRVVLGV